MKMSFRIFGAVTLFSIVSLSAVNSFELIFDRVEIDKPYIEGFYNVSLARITKFNRTTYVMNAEAETFMDIDEKVEYEVTFAYNRLNNNQYNISPFKIRRDKLCDLSEKYKNYLIDDQIKEKTNIPIPKPNEKVCPIKKVNKTFPSNNLHY